MQLMRCLCSFMQQWQLGSWPRGQSATARAGIWVLFRSAFPGAPLPPSPRGCRKNGAALRRQPMRYDTQPFETSRQTSSRSKFIASSTNWKRTERVFYVCSACILRSTFLTERSWHVALKCTLFTSFQRHSIHYLGDMHLVFTTFDAIL